MPELHADIIAAIQGFKPAAVITFGEDGLYWHQDHIAVHERTTTAVQAFGAEGPALYYVTMRQGVMRAIVDAAAARGWQPTPRGFWSLTPDAFGLHAAPPTFTVDVGRLGAAEARRAPLPPDPDGLGPPVRRASPPRTRATGWASSSSAGRLGRRLTAGRCSKRSPAAPCYANLRNGYVD